MIFRNTYDSYGWIAIVLHWLMAIVVFGLFALGLYMVELTYYDPWYRDALSLHKSIGVMLAMLWLLRMCWRMLNKQPKPLPGPKWEQWSAAIVHRLFYLWLALLFISGYLISTADGRVISVFGQFELPATIYGLANQADIAGDIHHFLAWGLICLVGIHALAAIKHHLINRDHTLKRMLKPGGNKK